jgi:hypothetical protein
VPLILVGLVGLSFFALAAAMSMQGMAQSRPAWLNALLDAFNAKPGGIIANAANWLFRTAAWPFRWSVSHVVNYVSAVLTRAASHAAPHLTHFFTGLAVAVELRIQAGADYAESVAHAIEGIVTHTIPRELHKVERTLGRRIGKAATAATAALLSVRALRRWIRHAIYANVLPRLRVAEHAIDVTLPREIGAARKRLGALERELEHPSKAWLRRVGAAIFGAVGLGLLLKTLARRFPWLFCRKVQTAGKRLCGLDAKLFESLLSDVLAISGTISIVAFARELRPFVDEFGSLIVRFFRELGIDPRDYLGSAGRSRDGVIPFLPLGPGEYL